MPRSNEIGGVVPPCEGGFKVQVGREDVCTGHKTLQIFLKCVAEGTGTPVGFNCSGFLEGGSVETPARRKALGAVREAPDRQRCLTPAAGSEEGIIYRGVCLFFNPHPRIC